MSGFAVMRHPDVTVAGVTPADAVGAQRDRGWYRVSEFRDGPDFNLPDFGPDLPDLDAPAEDRADTPKPKTRKPTAKPADDETEEQ